MDKHCLLLIELPIAYAEYLKKLTPAALSRITNVLDWDNKDDWDLKEIVKDLSLVHDG